MPTPEVKDNSKIESKQASSEKKEEVKVLANSFHNEKNLEKQVSVDQQKSQVGLLGIDAMNSGITPNDVDTFESEQDKKPENKDKSWSEKAGDFLRDNKKVVGRVAGFGSSILVYSMYKKWRKKKEEKEAKEGKEAGFLKRTRRTVLGIGATVGAGMLGAKIVNGLLDSTKDPDERETDDFKDLAPEVQEKYNKIGNATDDVYNSIFSTELQAGWQDDADMATVSEHATGGKEILKGVIPYVADKKYSSIDNMLSYRGEYMSIVNDSIENISSNIVGLVSGTWGFLKDRFFSVFKKTTEKQESFLDWIRKNPEQHAKELKFFAREILRLQTFVVEKEKQLVYKIASQKFAVTQGFDSIEDAMDDSDWMHTNVYNSPVYKNFKEGKIIDAFTTLDEYGLLNGDIATETKDLVKQLDDERAEIIGDVGHTNGLKEILDDVQDDGKIEQKTQQKMYAISQAVVKDMDEELLSAMKESFLAPLKKLFNTDEAALKDYLEKSGMLQAFTAIREGFQIFAQRVSEGKITPSDISMFVNTVNTYTAWKKEALIGSVTMQKIKSDKEGFDYVVAIGGTMFEFMKGTMTGLKGILHGDFTFNNFGYLFSGIAASGVILYISGNVVSVISPTTGKLMKLSGKWAFRGGVAPAWLAYKGVTSNFVARNFRGVYSGPAGLVRKVYFSGEKGPLMLWQKFEAGQISLKQAEGIIKNGLSSKLTSQETKNVWYSMFPNSDNIQTRLIEKKRGPLLMSNGITDAKKLSLITSYYDVGNVTILLKQDFNKALQQIESISLAESKLSGERAMLFEILKQKKKITLSNLDAIVTMLQSVDNSALQGMNLSNVAKTMLSKPGTYASSTNFLNTLKTMNSVPEIDYIKQLDDLSWKNIKSSLAGNHIDLFARCEKEIDNLAADAKSYVGKDKKVATAKAKDVVAMQNFAKDIQKLKQSEVADLLKILGKEGSHVLSLKSLAFLMNNATDAKALLTEIHAANKVGNVTEDIVRGILAKDTKLITSLKNAGMYDNVVKECFEFAGSTKLITKVADNLDILIKIFKIRF